MPKSKKIDASTTAQPKHRLPFWEKFWGIAAIVVIMGFATPVIAFLLLSFTAFTVKNANLNIFLALGPAIVFSAMIGSILLRGFLHSSWLTCVTSPIIATASMVAVASVAQAFYGENFLGYPLLLTLASFSLTFLGSVFLFDALRGWKAYALASLLIVFCCIGLEPLLKETTRAIWIAKLQFENRSGEDIMRIRRVK